MTRHHKNLVMTAHQAQAAAFAAITPAATGAASTLFSTGRQLGMAAGVAVLTTVASAVGLTKHVAAGTAPHLAASHTGLVTACVIALIAAGVAQFVDDRAAAATQAGAVTRRHYGRRSRRGRRMSPFGLTRGSASESPDACDVGSPRRV